MFTSLTENNKLKMHIIRENIATYHFPPISIHANNKMRTYLEIRRNVSLTFEIKRNPRLNDTNGIYFKFV